MQHTPPRNCHMLIVCTPRLAGDRLSIDYTNDFYHPRRVRQNHLQTVYGFQCTCSRCAVPSLEHVTLSATGELLTGPNSSISVTPLVEPFRVFKCAQSGCAEGRVCAVYVTCSDEEAAERAGFVRHLTDRDEDVEEGEEEEGEEGGECAEEPLVGLCCQSCGWRACADVVRGCLELEENLCDVTPESFADLEQWKAENNYPGPSEALSLHDHHYLFFWLVDDLAMALAEEMQLVIPGGGDGNDMTNKRKGLLSSCCALRGLVACLDENAAVPQYHAEKLIYWDRLAQLYIAAAECCDTAAEQEKASILHSARDAFQMAYDMSIKCAGESASNTIQLKGLLTDMPSTVAELQSRYQRAL